MDQKTLVEDAKYEGRRLLEELDSAGFDFSAAFWFWVPDISKWRLIIATPLIEKEGPIKAWEKLRQTWKKLRQSWQGTQTPLKLSLDDVWLTTPTDSLIQLLRNFAKTGPGIHDIDFTENVVNGVLIDAAHIYRII